MVKISSDEIRHLAHLSAIQLSDDEVTHMQHDLESVLSYVHMLEKLDTDGVMPTYQVNGQTNVFRDDVIESGVDTKALLDLAPSHDEYSVKVPKVL